MAPKNPKVLVVEPDARVRATIVGELSELRITVVDTPDGDTALKLLAAEPTIPVVITNLYVSGGGETCLTRAMRKIPALQQTRVVVHTARNNREARDWARAGGAVAFLVHPTIPERLRYVVGRLLTASTRTRAGRSLDGAIVRRASLGVALEEIEGGRLTGSSCIVFNLAWWDALTPRERNGYRRRSKSTGVALRTDSLMTTHSVEVRGKPNGPFARPQ